MTLITCQHEWVKQCQLRYRVDPPQGYHWENAHYPLPECKDGIDTVKLWYPDHIIHGAIQTLNLQHPCMHGYRVHQEREIIKIVYPEYLNLYEQAYEFCQKYAGRRCAELGAGVTNLPREQRVEFGKMAKPKCGEENGMYGRNHTEEAKKIQREAAKRQYEVLSQEEKEIVKKRLKAASIKRHKESSEEEKRKVYEKVSNSHKGRKHFVNEAGERLFQHEDPGEGWQRGMKWRQHD